jgi:uncharacterized coiled-coil DUF342 family protein
MMSTTLSEITVNATNRPAPTIDSHALAMEVIRLRDDVQRLSQQVLELRRETGYWKSQHANALKRIESLEEELEQARAEIRKLQQRLFGRKSEQHAERQRADLLKQAE